MRAGSTTLAGHIKATDGDDVGLFRPYEQGKTEKATAGEQKSNAARTVLTGRSPKPADPGAARPDSAAPTPEVEQTPTSRVPVKKDAPTRTRREAEAARRATMRPKTKKEWKQAEREAKWARRDAAMQASEKTPERVLLRDYIDARRTLLEFALPIMVLLLAMTFVVGKYPALYLAVLVLSYLLIAGITIDVWRIWRGYKREVASRIPRANTRALLPYAISRMTQMRRFRTPAPRVKPGDSY